MGALRKFLSPTQSKNIRKFILRSPAPALADASLELAYAFCRAEVEKDFGPLLLPGTANKNRFVILAVGKLGGRELNFSSDIDIVYLYEEEEGESEGGPRRQGTLEALRTLSNHRLVRPGQCRDLSEDYLFLRRLDHRLRLDRDQSIDVLEREGEKLHGIARALGFKGRDPGDLLLRNYELRRERLRARYEAFFKIEPGSGATSAPG